MSSTLTPRQARARAAAAEHLSLAREAHTTARHSATVLWAAVKGAERDAAVLLHLVGDPETMGESWPADRDRLARAMAYADAARLLRVRWRRCPIVGGAL